MAWATNTAGRKGRLLFRALGTAHYPFWSTTFWIRELNLLKVEPRHSYWLKPTREFCLVSRHRGVSGELRPGKLSNSISEHGGR